MSNTQDPFVRRNKQDEFDSFFECITSCYGLSGEDAQCVTDCVAVHLKDDTPRDSVL